MNPGILNEQTQLRRGQTQEGLLGQVSQTKELLPELKTRMAFGQRTAHTKTGLTGQIPLCQLALETGDKRVMGVWSLWDALGTLSYICCQEWGRPSKA